MADKWADLFADVDAQPTVDMGPEARRARAGMAPMPRHQTAEQAGVMSNVLKDAGHGNFGPNAVGPQRMQFQIQDTYESPPFAPEDVRAGRAPSSTYDMSMGQVEDFNRMHPAGTPEHEAASKDVMDKFITRQLVPSALGGAAGKFTGTVAGAVPKVGKYVAPVAAGTVGGGTASKAAGGDFTTGAAVGGAFGAVGAVGSALLSRAGSKMYREIGRAATGKTQEKIAGLGESQMVNTAREIGFDEANDWTTRAKLSDAARQNVGSKIGQAWESIDKAAYGSRPTQQVSMRLEELKNNLSRTTEGKKLIGPITNKQEELRQLYGDNIPVSALNREIGKLEELGYSGEKVGELSQKAARKIPRLMAGAMNRELDMSLEAALSDPAFRATAQSIPGLNQTFKSVLALQAVSKRMAAKEPFRQTFGEKFAEHPIRTTAGLGVKAVTAPFRAVGELTKALSDAPQVSPGMAAALSSNNRDAAASEMASELFGRPVLGMKPAGVTP